MGGFIADFLCTEAKLIIEIDGSQHAESDYDVARSAELKLRGFRVLRFWNDEVLRDSRWRLRDDTGYVGDLTLQPWR